MGSIGLDMDIMDSFHGKEAKSTGEAGMRKLLRRFNNREFDLVSVGGSHIGMPNGCASARRAAA